MGHSALLTTALLYSLCLPVAPTAAPTAPISSCFREDDAGGGVLKQTIGHTAATTGADPTQQDMETCGWAFAPGTQLHQFCPGNPYRHDPYSRWLHNDYRPDCSIDHDMHSDAVASASEPEPMVQIFHNSTPQGSVSYPLPSTPGFCRFRVKFYERMLEHYYTSLDQAFATVKLGGRLVWTQNDTHSAFHNASASSCASVISGAFEPGDVLNFTERSILALFWVELIPEGSPQCALVPAEVTASACCGNCPIPAAPTVFEAVPTVGPISPCGADTYLLPPTSLTMSSGDPRGAHNHCVSDARDSGRYNSSVAFFGLNLNLSTLRADTAANLRDFTTMIMGMYPYQLGQAESCGYSSGHGTADIDLIGTPFAVDDHGGTRGTMPIVCDHSFSEDEFMSGGEAVLLAGCPQWEVYGWRPFIRIECTDGNQRCHIECGGGAGGCRLRDRYLQLKIVDNALFEQQCMATTTTTVISATNATYVAAGNANTMISDVQPISDDPSDSSTTPMVVVVIAALAVVLIAAAFAIARRSATATAPDSVVIVPPPPPDYTARDGIPVPTIQQRQQQPPEGLTQPVHATNGLYDSGLSAYGYGTARDGIPVQPQQGQQQQQPVHATNSLYGIPVQPQQGQQQQQPVHATNSLYDSAPSPHYVNMNDANTPATAQQ